MLEAINNFLTSGWISTIFAFAAIASTIIIVFIILSENRNPVKSLAWVTVLLLLPVVGVILYIFFGRSIKNKHMISRRNRRKLRRNKPAFNTNVHQLGLSEETALQVNLGRSMQGAMLFPYNTVQVFPDGRGKFDSLIADLRGATHTINLQYYIFEEDNIGREIADVLIHKARQGVKVRVIYDHVGSIHVRNRFFRRLRDNGVEAYPFFRVSFPMLATRINWRNHRKICIIDGTAGYIGGMNIADRYIDGKPKFSTWRDTHVRVTGPIVHELNYSFAVDWNFMCGELIDADPAEENAKLIPAPDAVRNVSMQMLTSGPTSQWSNIALAFYKAIASSSRRVYIQTPYFLPTESLLRVLQASALSHVDVRIMMPRRSDSAMLSYASASYISECLRAGIKIYFYEPGMLHSKTMIIDDEFVSIGSTNFDFRSFDCNFEANLFFYSREFNARMVDRFREDLKQCTRVIPAVWRKRKITSRVAESILRLLSPIL